MLVWQVHAEANEGVVSSAKRDGLVYCDVVEVGEDVLQEVSGHISGFVNHLGESHDAEVF